MASTGRRTPDALSGGEPAAPARDPHGSGPVPAGVRPAPAARPASAWPKDSVAQRLFSEGFAFDFFQAVRLLHQLDPARAPVGYGTDPLNEIVRFRAHVSVNFPASSIFELKQPLDLQRPPELTVTFLGLFGPSGILPRHYTELLLRMQRDAKGPEKFALRDWLDLFNHRFIAHFYRAWEKYRFTIGYERGLAQRTEPDTFTTALYSLVGLGMPPLRNRLRVACWEEEEGRHEERLLGRVNDLVLIYYSGLLSHRPRTAVGLAGILHDYLRLPVAIRQFQGQWLILDPENQSRIGVPDGNNELGVNLVIGERVWDVQGKIRIRLGPLKYATFLEFMPDRTPMPERKAFFEVVHLVRLYVGPELDFDLQLILKADEVPECQLPEGTADGPQLGWNSWIGTQSYAEPADNAVFEGEEVVWL